MRTSLIETQHIEQFIQKKADTEEQLLFEANMLVNNELKERVDFQRQAYIIVQEYGRRKVKKVISAIDKGLFNSLAYSGFQRKINSYFK